MNNTSNFHIFLWLMQNLAKTSCRSISKSLISFLIGISCVISQLKRSQAIQFAPLYLLTFLVIVECAKGIAIIQIKEKSNSWFSNA